MITIKDARLKAGLTQEEVVSRLKKQLGSEMTICSWSLKENYKRKISAVELIEFADIVGISPKEIELK